MTQYCLLPPCAISLEVSSPLFTPILPMPRLAFQLTCSRWAAQWEDTGKGRCVYFPEKKCCTAADGSALEQVAAFDTTATQPGHLDRQGWLTFGDGEIWVREQESWRAGARMIIMKLLDFRYQQQKLFTNLGNSILPRQTSVSSSTVHLCFHCRQSSVYSLLLPPGLNMT